MKCTYCGAEMDDDAKFCTECGSQIDESNEDAIEQDTVLLSDADEETTVLSDVYDDDDDEATDDQSDIDDEEETETSYADTELLTDSDDYADEEEIVTAAPQASETPNTSVTAPSSLLTKTNLLTAAVVVLSLTLIIMISYSLGNKNEAKHASHQSLVVLTQPQDVTVTPGQETTFVVEADGFNLTYQWYYRKAGDDLWHKWKNHEASSTQATANESWDGMQVYCNITDNYRVTVASDIATIEIKQDSLKKDTSETQSTVKDDATKDTETTKKDDTTKKKQ